MFVLSGSFRVQRLPLLYVTPILRFIVYTRVLPFSCSAALFTFPFDIFIFDAEEGDFIEKGGN